MQWLFVGWQFGLQLLCSLLQGHLFVEHLLLQFQWLVLSSPVPCTLTAALNETTVSGILSSSLYLYSASTFSKSAVGNVYLSCLSYSPVYTIFHPRRPSPCTGETFLALCRSGPGFEVAPHPRFGNYVLSPRFRIPKWSPILKTGRNSITNIRTTERKSRRNT